MRATVQLDVNTGATQGQCSAHVTQHVLQNALYF